MKRKTVCLLLVAALLISLMPTAVMAGYTDVQVHWEKDAIEEWSGLGILQGQNGKFRPDDPITRGEIAVIIDRIMQFRAKDASIFSDLGESFCTEAVLKASAAGIIKGHDNMARPFANSTREEAIVLLGRTLGLDQKLSNNQRFSDSAAISSWAAGYVNTMAEKGYVKGYNGRLNPKDSITRAEFVSILDNSIEVIFNKGTIYSQNITGTAIINTTNVTLNNMTIAGNLIISEGVGDGDVTLENVKVLGKTIVRGGGANSIRIIGNSSIASIIIEKTDSGEIRVVASDGTTVGSVYVEDGKDDVILTGKFEHVSVSANATIQAVGAEINKLEVSAAGAEIIIAAGTNVNELTVNAKITIDNKGRIGSAAVNANGVVVDGNKPASITVSPNVTEKPADSNGNVIGSGPAAIGGGFAGGGAPPPPPIEVPQEIVVGIAGFKEAQGDGNLGKYSVSGTGSAKNYTVTVTTTDNLVTFDSADLSKGRGKWIGVVVGTDKDTNTLQYKTSGGFSDLTQADAQEAQAAGALDAKSIVYWLKAEEIAAGKTIYLKVQGQPDSAAVAITVNFSLMDYTGIQAATPTLFAKTSAFVSLNIISVAGETIEYAMNTINEAPVTGWQSSNVFVENITRNTTYYFFARVKEAPEFHKAGAVSAAFEVTTNKYTIPEVRIDLAAPQTGNTPNTASVDSDRYQVVSTSWENGDLTEATLTDGKFNTDTSYIAEITLEPAVGCVWWEHISVIVSGATRIVSQRDGDEGPMTVLVAFESTGSYPSRTVFGEPVDLASGGISVSVDYESNSVSNDVGHDLYITLPNRLTQLNWQNGSEDAITLTFDNDTRVLGTNLHSLAKAYTKAMGQPACLKRFNQMQDTTHIFSLTNDQEEGSYLVSVFSVAVAGTFNGTNIPYSTVTGWDCASDDLFLVFKTPDYVSGMVLDTGVILADGSGQAYANFKIAIGGEVKTYSTISVPYTDVSSLIKFDDNTTTVVKGTLVEFSLTSDGKIALFSSKNPFRALVAQNAPISYSVAQTGNIGYVADFSGNLLAVTTEKTKAAEVPAFTIFKVADDVHVYEVKSYDIGSATLSARGAVMAIKINGMDRTKIVFAYDHSSSDDSMHKITEIYVIKVPIPSAEQKVTGMLLDAAFGSGFDSNSALFRVAVNGEKKIFSTTSVATADRNNLMVFASGSSIPGAVTNGTLVEFTLNADDEIIVDSNHNALKSLVAYNSEISFVTTKSSNVGYVENFSSNSLSVTDAQNVGDTAAHRSIFGVAEDVKVYEMYDNNISSCRVAGKDTIQVITAAGKPRAKIVFVYDVAKQKATEIYIIKTPAERLRVTGMLLDTGAIYTDGSGQSSARFKIAMDGRIDTFSTTLVAYENRASLTTYASGSSIAGAVTKGTLVEFNLTADNKIILDSNHNALKGLMMHNSTISFDTTQIPNLGYVAAFSGNVLIVTDANTVGGAAVNEVMFGVADDAKVYEMDINDTESASVSDRGAVEVITAAGETRTKIVFIYDTAAQKIKEIYVIQDLTPRKFTGLLIDSTFGSGFDYNSALYKIAVNGAIRQFLTTSVSSTDRNNLMVFASGSSIPGEVTNGTLVEFTLNSNDKIIVDANHNALKSLIKYNSPISFSTSQTPNIGYVADYSGNVLTLTDAKIVGGTAANQVNFEVADDANIYGFDVDENDHVTSIVNTIDVVTETGRPRTKIVFVNDTAEQKVTDIYVFKGAIAEEPTTKVTGMLIASAAGSEFSGDTALFKIAVNGEIKIYSTTAVGSAYLDNLFTFASGSSISGEVTNGTLVEFDLNSDGKIVLDANHNALKSLIQYNSPISFDKTQTPNIGYVADFSGNLLAVTTEKTNTGSVPAVTIFKVADDVKVYEVRENDISSTTVSARGAVMVIKVNGVDRIKVVFVYDRSSSDESMHKITEIYVIKP